MLLLGWAKKVCSHPERVLKLELLSFLNRCDFDIVGR